MLVLAVEREAALAVDGEQQEGRYSRPCKGPCFLRWDSLCNLVEASSRELAWAYRERSRVTLRGSEPDPEPLE